MARRRDACITGIEMSKTFHYRALLSLLLYRSTKDDKYLLADSIYYCCVYEHSSILAKEQITDFDASCK